MKWYKKILIILLSIVLFVLLLNFGLNYWIDRQLPRIINENNNSPYQISYKHLDITLLDRTLLAKDIILVPKISLNDNAQKAGYYAKVKSIEVNGFSIWNIIFSDKITARKLIINYPEGTLFKKGDEKDKGKKGSPNMDYFSKIIYVSDIYLNHGNFTVTDIIKNERVMKLNNVSFQVEGILVTDETLSEELPFTYRDFLVTTDSVYYRMDPYYHLKTQNIKATNNSLLVSKPEIIPVFGRKEFLKIIPAEKDLYTILFKSIDVSNIDWGFKSGKLFVHTRSVVMDGVIANIYRGKMPPDDMTEKKFFSKVLRELKFDLKIDTLRLKNSNVVYEEEKDIKAGPGKISFSQFNLWAVNIISGFEKKKLPDVRIHVNCKFMDIAPFKTDWSFNVLDKSDGFRIKGSILNFPADKLEPFTKPYSNTILEGNLEEIYFDLTGNKFKSKGTFGINYDDLKVKIYRKNDRKKKNKFISAVVNLFVKNDTKEKVKRTEVEVERIREKSFFNLLWLSTAEGLKKILI